jgi:hypothetical protein
MLPKSDYLQLLEREPEITFFYHDRPVLYTICHNGENYLVSFTEEDIEKQTERYLLVQYSESTFNLLQQGEITFRQFFIHPKNNVHNVLLEYSNEKGLTLALSEPYDENSDIPDEYLPSPDARWL